MLVSNTLPVTEEEGLEQLSLPKQLQVRFLLNSEARWNPLAKSSLMLPYISARTMSYKIFSEHCPLQQPRGNLVFICVRYAVFENFQGPSLADFAAL